MSFTVRDCLYWRQDETIREMVSTQSYPHKNIFCLYEARTFFIPHRQGGIPLETDGTPAKAEQKSPYKWFVPG